MNTQQKKEFVYVRFSMESDHLTRLQRLALSRLGVTCIDDGGEHEAYGIIPNDIYVIQQHQLLDDFTNVELGEPRTGC